MFTPQQQRSYDQLEAALEAHGYFIEAKPIEGMEEVFLADLREAFAKVEQTAQHLRNKWGYRGRSANLLRELHISLPCPSFNVDSRLRAQIEAQERRGR